MSAETMKLDLVDFKLIQFFSGKAKVEISPFNMSLYGTSQLLFVFQKGLEYIFVAFDFSSKKLFTGIQNIVNIRTLNTYDYEIVKTFNSAYSVEGLYKSTKETNFYAPLSLNIEYMADEVSPQLEVNLAHPYFTITVKEDDSLDAYELILQFAA